MVGDQRRKIAEAIKDATDKAGTLVTAALAIAGAALLVACCALAAALRIRVRHAG